ncbi:MAG TPA: Gfo/Idh/MocA family oxidoreductase [Candidatus Dormibacteraeota bacterium]|nr:Gfo/Idh/MocA family oxidoreductase [Candidatus Dormibacteraeota bacterium]
MTQPRLRIGIIGCGLIAQVMHLHYLRELEDHFDVVALCDLSQSIVDRLGDQYGVERRLTDWTALIDLPLDAVMVLTSGSHEPIAVAAAEAGRHVFIEKPIALSEQEGNAIVSAGRRAGVRLMVGYMKRYDPAVERMAEELRSMPTLRFARSTTSEYPLKWYVAHYPLVRGSDIDGATLEALQADDEARITRAIEVSDPVLRYVYRHSLLDSMIHDINLMRGLLGDPVALRFARVGDAGVSLFVDFPRTGAAMHWVNLLDGVARYQQEFTFFSPAKTAALHFPSPFLRNEPTGLVLEAGNEQSPEAWQTVETVSYEGAFKRELLEFHACITGDREPRTTASEAVLDVAFCQAVIRAASSEIAFSGRSQGSLSSRS